VRKSEGAAIVFVGSVGGAPIEILWQYITKYALPPGVNAWARRAIQSPRARMINVPEIAAT